MEFRTFLEINENKTTFTFGELEVSIEELLTEESLLSDPYKVGDKKKYRVTFRKPKTKAKYLVGDWEEKTVYVMARSLFDAKNLVIKQLARQGFNKRYLKDLDKNLLGLSGQQVSRWSDLVNLIKYLANERMYNQDKASFFDKHDYQIFLDKARKSDMRKVLSNFDEREFKVLKLFYNKMKGDKAIPLEMVKGLDKAFRGIKPTASNLKIADKPAGRFSVYAATPQQREALWMRLYNVRSIRDVIQLAHAFGFSTKELKDYHDYMYEDTERQEDEQRALHSQLTKWMGRHRSSKIAQEKDFTAFKNWQYIIKATRDNSEWSHFWGQDEGDLERNLWDFYLNGPKVKPKYYYWRDALVKMDKHILGLKMATFI